MDEADLFRICRTIQSIMFDGCHGDELCETHFHPSSWSCYVQRNGLKFVQVDRRIDQQIPDITFAVITALKNMKF